MCEHREITTYLPEELVTDVRVPSPEVSSEASFLPPARSASYYSALKTRTKSWRIMCRKPEVEKTKRACRGLSEQQTRDIWILVNLVQYDVRDIPLFFETLMELAIEERARFTSFADPALLRPWVADIVSERFEDEHLLYLYLCIRDGERHLLDSA